MPTTEHEDRLAPALQEALGPDAEAARAWLLFADPFRLDVESLVVGMAQTFPDAAVVGGLASGHQWQRKTHLFIDDGDQPVPVRDEGALLIGLGGDWTVRTLVAQGCIPIGEPWTITESEGPIIHTIAGRPALDVLVDTLEALPPEVQRRAQRGGPFVGLAVDEHRTTLGSGDFLVRNLLGFDRERGVIAVGAHPQVGQTLQFHLRDRAAADEELHSMLSAVETESTAVPPLAALLCSCTGPGRRTVRHARPRCRRRGARPRPPAAGRFFLQWRDRPGRPAQLRPRLHRQPRAPRTRPAGADRLTTCMWYDGPVPVVVNGAHVFREERGSHVYIRGFCYS